MSEPAFTLATHPSFLNAAYLNARIPSPCSVDHVVYPSVYAMITEQASACDGHDLTASVTYLMLCCNAMAELARDMASYVSRMLPDTDAHDDVEHQMPDDDIDHDAAYEELEPVAPTLSDFEHEELGQMVLPFAGIAEHFAALETARARGTCPPSPTENNHPRRFPRFFPTTFPFRRTAFSDGSPEDVVTYRGVTVSHTYKYNDAPDYETEEWDNQQMQYWYQVDGSKFDIRYVPGWYEGGSHIDILCDAIDMRIDLAAVGFGL